MAEIYRRTSHITGPTRGFSSSWLSHYLLQGIIFSPNMVLKHLEEHKPSTEAKKGGYFPQGPGQCLKEPERLAVSL